MPSAGAGSPRFAGTLSGPSLRLPRARRPTVDLVVSDRAQLGEAVRRLRAGRLRTNIGTVAALDDPVALSDRADQGEDDHPRSSVRTRDGRRAVRPPRQ